MSANAPHPLRARLPCNVTRVDDIFADCLREASATMAPAAIERYLEGASTLCGMGRGQDLPVIYLQVMPLTVRHSDASLLDSSVELAQFLSRAGAAKAIAPLLAALPNAARRLASAESLGIWFDLIRRLAQEAPAGLVAFLNNSDRLLAALSIGGLRNWVAFGLRAWRHHLHDAADYFELHSPDARAALQRERAGTLLVDQQRCLALTLKAAWSLDEELLPFSADFDLDATPRPHLDRAGFHLPDALEDRHGISGLDRYRATLAHLAAHRRWTTPLIADNFNRYQQLIVETFEDARVEWLAMQRFPGLRRLWLALHPIPREGDCPAGMSCIRHRAAMLSRALLDPAHPYRDARLLRAVEAFHARMAAAPLDSRLAAELGVDYLTQIHETAFRSPEVYFTDTEVSYRDDNRFLWIFLEDTDDEDDFHSEHHAANPRLDEAAASGFARHHPEWDRENESYRPDWTTVYESPPATADAAVIDRLLDAHRATTRRLSAVIDRLLPQGRVRLRHQEEGSELDLDLAVRAQIDRLGGRTPDERIHERQIPDERSVAVLVLVDLSESIKETPAGADRSLLQLSQEAVALLGWSLDRLGDPYAIGGFSSNSRHEVRYFPFKGFTEAWSDEVKARLAGMQGAWSTRMGAALRHAGHYLARQSAERKLLLLLTDGEPSDIDVDDPGHLIADSRKAVEELDARGISSFCLSLDKSADAYVRDIFGSRYRVLDNAARLPEQLPALYLQLTG